MDTTKIIEAVTKLNELELQEVLEAIEGYASKNNMEHLLRNFTSEEMDAIRSNLDSAQEFIKELYEKNRSLRRILNDVRENLEEMSVIANRDI